VETAEATGAAEALEAADTSMASIATEAIEVADISIASMATDTTEAVETSMAGQTGQQKDQRLGQGWQMHGEKRKEQQQKEIAGSITTQLRICCPFCNHYWSVDM
jgi:hypothetical protein